MTIKSSFSRIGIIVLLLCALAVAVRIGDLVFQLKEKERAVKPIAETPWEKTQALVKGFLLREDLPPPGLAGEFPCVFASLRGHDAIPQLGKCGYAQNPAEDVDRFEADLRYGRFLVRQTDLSLQDFPGARLTRAYNSGDYLHPNRVHAFGRNANHSFDIAPLGTRDPFTYQLLVFEEGDFLYFDRVSPGTEYADAIYQHTETSTRFYKAVTAWNTFGWTTWLADGSRIVFPASAQATNMAQGAPTEMTDSSGNKVGLIRDAQGNLLEIRAPKGPPMKFTYDDQARITRAETGTGDWARYVYNEDGMLSDVSWSSGRGRHYSYDGDRMTMVKDETGVVLVRNTYAPGGFLIAQQFSGGKKFSYRYSPSQNRAYAESAVVTAPDGSQVRVELSSSVPNFIKNPPH